MADVTGSGTLEWRPLYDGGTHAQDSVVAATLSLRLPEMCQLNFDGLYSTRTNGWPENKFLIELVKETKPGFFIGAQWERYYSLGDNRIWGRVGYRFPVRLR
jgi:hypothetical protein